MEPHQSSSLSSSPPTEPVPTFARGAAWRPFAWLVAACAIGAALRFTWNSDMEFKFDESWMFERSIHVGRDEPWPTLGMPSGVGLRNPGLSVVAFSVLSRLFGANTPLQLELAVVSVNVIAFAALGLFIWRAVPDEEREAWIWGGALAAVNPIGLLLQRKIWAQSILPLFCVLFLWSFFRRDRRPGAFAWGLIGALLGQIHMSGLFFSAAFFLAALAGAERPGSLRLRSPWGFWFAGSVVGAIPLLPWVRYVLSGKEHGPPWSLRTVLDLDFFRMIPSDMLGLGLDYSLGPKYTDFLTYPKFADTLYPGLYLQGVSFTCGFAVVLFALRALWSKRHAWRSALRWPFQTSETAFTVLVALGVYGLLLTASGASVQRHYLLITFPLETVFLALLALRFAPSPRVWLSAIWVAELGLSMIFLHYIHVNGGAVGGDYGAAYRGP